MLLTPLMAAYNISYATEFNMAVLDARDRNNVDLSRFSEKGYIMPGGYSLDIIINGQSYESRYIKVYPSGKKSNKSVICLTPELISKIGFTNSSLRKIKWTRNNECADYSDIAGMDVKVSLSKSTLEIIIPKSYLEYSSDDWDPPVRWDDGVNGFIFDYYTNIQRINQSQGHSITDLSAYGTTGFNIGAWRFRGDYQAGYHENGSRSTRDLSWSRYYLYRALPMIQSKLTIGENYLISDLFDTFRYSGVNLSSDDNMLPPNLRGYAPEITGVTSSNAKVTVMQSGRVIYETNVGTGPFRIQTLNSGMKGLLDVKVQEQNGNVGTFQVNTDSVSFLTRPGHVRYKLSMGKPSQYKHKSQGPNFVFSEAAWGINNTWSLFGGSILSSDYNAVSGGVGHDMGPLGTMSIDATTMRAVIPSERATKGNAYKISYSKNFDDYNSQFTMSDYRFTESNYLSMGDYLSKLSGDSFIGKSKDLYTVSFSKRFEDPAVSLYLNYNYHTYWDKTSSDRYSMTLSKLFSIGKFRHISMNATVYKSSTYGSSDNGGFLSVTIPINDTGIASMYLQKSGGDISKNIAYSDRLNNNDTYQLSAGLTSKNKALLNGSYSHDGDIADIDTSLGYSDGDYNSVSASVQGGLTVTSRGAAMHRIAIPGSTRIFVDADDIENIPVNAGGNSSYTNRWGKATVADINEYYRTNTAIDIKNLPSNAEAEHSISTSTLTEGAIGYQHFDIVSGEKRWGIIRLSNNSYPPFGAEIRNSVGKSVGVVTDEGHVYLTGLKADTKLNVYWGGQSQCVVSVPKLMHLNDGYIGKLLLPCI